MARIVLDGIPSKYIPQSLLAQHDDFVADHLTKHSTRTYMHSTYLVLSDHDHSDRIGVPLTKLFVRYGLVQAAILCRVRVADVDLVVSARGQLRGTVLLRLGLQNTKVDTL